ncbi:hypothetical protein XENORESO_017229, partial [Xenotaenia resolanae]
MPCLQNQCGSSPQGASPASQSAGAERTCEFLTPEFVKFSMDLTNSELSAATSGAGFGPLADSYLASYDAKPPCVFQMPAVQAEQPCVKVEDAQGCPRYQNLLHSSDELLSSQSSMYYYRTPSPRSFHSPHGHIWEDSGSLYKNALSRFSLFSLKHTPHGAQSFPTCQMKFDVSEVQQQGKQLGIGFPRPLQFSHSHHYMEYQTSSG